MVSENAFVETVHIVQVYFDSKCPLKTRIDLCETFSPGCNEATNWIYAYLSPSSHLHALFWT